MLDPYLRLKEAVIRDKLSVVKTLLRRFPDLLKAKDASNNGWSLLHYASYYGNYLVCVYLIQLGCDSNGNISTDFTGKCPIHVSIIKGDEQTSHLLLQHFPLTIEYRDFDGNVPLLLACQHGNHKVLNLLISCSANINARNNNGDNGLHLALKNGHLESCKILLQYGLNDSMMNNDNFRPSDVAFTFETQRKFISMTKEVVPFMKITESGSLASANSTKPNSAYWDNASIYMQHMKNSSTTKVSNPISDAIGNPFKSKKQHAKNSTGIYSNGGLKNRTSLVSGAISIATPKERDPAADLRTFNQTKNDDTVTSEGALATPLLSGNNTKILFPFIVKNDSTYSFSNSSLNNVDISSPENDAKVSETLSEENDENKDLNVVSSVANSLAKEEDQQKRQSLLDTVSIAKLRRMSSD